MPYYNRDPQRGLNFDNPPYKEIKKEKGRFFGVQVNSKPGFPGPPDAARAFGRGSLELAHVRVQLRSWFRGLGFRVDFCAKRVMNQGF